MPSIEPWQYFQLGLSGISNQSYPMLMFGVNRVERWTLKRNPMYLHRFNYTKYIHLITYRRKSDYISFFKSVPEPQVVYNGRVGFNSCKRIPNTR